VSHFKIQTGLRRKVKIKWQSMIMVAVPPYRCRTWKRVLFNVLYKTRFSRHRMIWFLPSPANRLSFSVFLCVAVPLPAGRGGGEKSDIIRRRESLVLYYPLSILSDTRYPYVICKNLKRKKVVPAEVLKLGWLEKGEKFKIGAFLSGS
jgi:hypothetical protein